jgi:hypothetical protein
MTVSTARSEPLPRTETPAELAYFSAHEFAGEMERLVRLAKQMDASQEPTLDATEGSMIHSASIFWYQLRQVCPEHVVNLSLRVYPLGTPLPVFGNHKATGSALDFVMETLPGYLASVFYLEEVREACERVQSGGELCQARLTAGYPYEELSDFVETVWSSDGPQATSKLLNGLRNETVDFDSLGVLLRREWLAVEALSESENVHRKGGDTVTKYSSSLRDAESDILQALTEHGKPITHEPLLVKAFGKANSHGKAILSEMVRRGLIVSRSARPRGYALPHWTFPQT